MNIGLMAVDSVYPNLALMKISSWHKANGDHVEWYNPFDEYDVVYMSKVFSFTEDYRQYMTNAKEIRQGGTVSPTLMASGEGSCIYEGKVEKQYRIRKLTPKECFRLMGVSESNIEKIQNSGVSQSQQYKMAGNSIVVDVLEHIFRKMFVDTGQESQQLLLF